jgi:hypothetical protein
MVKKTKDSSPRLAFGRVGRRPSKILRSFSRSLSLIKYSEYRLKTQHLGHPFCLWGRSLEELGLISVVPNCIHHSTLAFVVDSVTTRGCPRMKIENSQKVLRLLSQSNPLLRIHSNFTNRIKSITMPTMPPQVDQAVAKVDQFMKNYPTLTQYGT